MLLKKMNFLKISIIVFVIIFSIVYYYFGLEKYFRFESIESLYLYIKTITNINHISFIFFFFLTYILVVALSLPLATIMTLMAGVFFSLLEGIIIVSFASSIGATFSFLLSRFVLFDYIRNKYNKRINIFIEKFEKEGTFYLFAIRLVPLFPFVIVNLLMGLTKIKLWNYYIVTQISMLPATVLYVLAGSTFSRFKNFSEIINPITFLILFLIGVFPITCKYFIFYLRKLRKKKIFKKTKSV